MAQYTSTDSRAAGAFARTSFSEDLHRINALVIGGKIKNDYDDYLGTGVPLKSEDNIRAVIGRYLYRLSGDWFIGGQIQLSRTIRSSAKAHSMRMLSTFSALQDSNRAASVRSSTMTHGTFRMHRNAGGSSTPTTSPIESESPAMRISTSTASTTGSSGRMAIATCSLFDKAINGPWMHRYPAYAPVLLRGYTTGEYLGQNMSSLEIEERYALGLRWTATFFAGAACLYGDGLTCTDSANTYPTVGLGVQFLLKPDKGVVCEPRVCPGQRRQQRSHLQDRLRVVGRCPSKLSVTRLVIHSVVHAALTASHDKPAWGHDFPQETAYRHPFENDPPAPAAQQIFVVPQRSERLLRSRHVDHRCGWIWRMDQG